MKLYLFLFVTVGVFFLGCDLYPQDEYQEYYVVEAYMIAQNDLPPIFLSTTAPVSSRYTFEDYAVVGASVKVELLSGDENSTIQ